MTRTSTIDCLKVPAALAALAFAAVLALLLLAAPAQAADPTFPIGSRIGLVPPPGMLVSKNYLGFEDIDKDAAILLASQVAAAYPDIEKSLTPESLKSQGITIDKRETMQFPFGNGVLVTGKQTDDKDKKVYRKYLLVAQASDLTVLVNAQVPEQETAYPDAAMHAAMASVALRASVPDSEKLSLLPFTVGDMAGFHVQSVLPGRALVLIDNPKGVPAADDFEARMFVAAFPGGPSEADDRAQFARLAFDQIIGIKEVRLTMSEPLRINGQSGFQTMAQAKDARTNDDIMVAQWLRFGGGAFMQMIGMAKADGWTTALTRMRAIRDSIEPK
jgi:hypothetical protein